MALPEDMLTTTEVAQRIGRTPAVVRNAARVGKLDGAVCEETPRGKVWMIPARYADPAVYEAAVGPPGRRPAG